MKSLLKLAEKNPLHNLQVNINGKLTVLLTGLALMGCLPFSDKAKAESFWVEQSVGWHWYQNSESDQSAVDKVTSPIDPITTMSALQHQVQHTLDLAILNPTEENIQNYIVLQNQLGERAQRFAEVWRNVLLQSPALDFSLQHPTNQVAKQIYLDRNRQQEEDRIKNLAKNSGLFFFYRSTCPYCQRFAPIVKDFSKRYGWVVIPITTDGISLPEFPHSHQDQGQAARLKVTVEPALFTADPHTHRIIPVSYGLLSEDELRQRLLTIAQQAESPGRSQ